MKLIDETNLDTAGVEVECPSCGELHCCELAYHWRQCLWCDRVEQMRQDLADELDRSESWETTLWREAPWGSEV